MERLCAVIYETSEAGRKTLHDVLVAYAIGQNVEVVIRWLKAPAEEEAVRAVADEAQLALVNGADGAEAARIGLLLRRFNRACSLIYYGDGAREDVPQTVDYFSALIPAAPIRYLHRPSPAEFTRAICQCAAAAGDGQHFLWETKGMKYRVPFETIQYFRSDRNYITLHLLSGAEYAFLGKLSGLEDRLPKGRFVRVHQSYLVNRAEIVAVDKQKKAVHLKDGNQLYVSKARYQETLEACGPG